MNDAEKLICPERLITIARGSGWNPGSICQQQTAFSKVWAAASEAKPQPPTDFVWEEQSKFRSNPDCTTILCKPNGEVSVRVTSTRSSSHCSLQPSVLLTFLHSIASVTVPQADQRPSLPSVRPAADTVLLTNSCLLSLPSAPPAGQLEF